MGLFLVNSNVIGLEDEKELFMKNFHTLDKACGNRRFHGLGNRDLTGEGRAYARKYRNT